MQGLTLQIRGLDGGPDLLYQLDDGDAGTAQTIAAMREMAHAFAGHELVRVVAASVRASSVSLLQRMPGSSVRATDLAALFGWFKRRVRFCADPTTIELVQRPDELIGQIQAKGKACGDCDDASVLGAAILLALGHKPVFITVARGGNFAHVYWGARDAWGSVIPMDPQEFDQVGEEASGVTRRVVWEV